MSILTVNGQALSQAGACVLTTKGASTHAFETHLQACQDCSALLHTYKATIQATRAVAHAEVPFALVNRV